MKVRLQAHRRERILEFRLSTTGARGHLEILSMGIDAIALSQWRLIISRRVHVWSLVRMPPRVSGSRFRRWRVRGDARFASSRIRRGGVEGSALSLAKVVRSRAALVRRFASWRIRRGGSSVSLSLAKVVRSRAGLPHGVSVVEGRGGGRGGVARGRFDQGTRSSVEARGGRCGAWALRGCST